MQVSAGYGFDKCVSGDTRVRRTRENQFDADPNIRVDTLYEQFNSETPVGKKYRRYGLCISGGDGETRKDVRIRHVYQNGIKPLLQITTRSFKQIRVTFNHRLMTIDGWKAAGKLTLDDELRTFESRFENIIAIEHVGSEMTYDIEVDDKSHAFYANGILSHNSHAVCRSSALGA